jgi:phosphoglycerol transferase MdoB-like AlkP superfamily enzyme
VAILCGIPPRLGFEIVEGDVDGIGGRCLPALLEEQGYATALFTTALLSFEDNDAMFAHMGFGQIRGRNDFRDRGFEELGYIGLDDRAAVAPALEWIDGVTQKQTPFFLTYVTIGGHHPYHVPEDHQRQAFPQAIAAEQANYFNALRHTDDVLRDLFRGFEKRGRLDSTLFIILGDHGEAFGEHGRWVHNEVPWEEGLHVVGLIVGPDIAAGRILGVRQQIDIVPTVAAGLGFEIAGGKLPGYDLLGPVPDDRRVYFSSWFANWLAYREGPTKHIYHFGVLPPEAYDLVRDPLEQQNIADAEGARRAEVELRRWAASVRRQHHR